MLHAGVCLNVAHTFTRVREERADNADPMQLFIASGCPNVVVTSAHGKLHTSNRHALIGFRFPTLLPKAINGESHYRYICA